jgi:hypothetical protein
MSKKPSGYYSKKDRYGNSKVHPIFASQGTQHSEPRAQTYRVEHPARTVELKLVNVPVNEVQFSESRPVNLDERASYFVDMYKQGKTIPPILIHKLPRGKYEVIDGHARLEAYRRLGVTEIPAVENSVAEIVRKIGKGIGYVAGLPGGFARTVEEGKAIAHGRGEPVIMRRERAISRMEKRLAQLKKMARSRDPYTRRLAITRLHREFPEEIEALEGIQR